MKSIPEQVAAAVGVMLGAVIALGGCTLAVQITAHMIRDHDAAAAEP